MFEVAFGGILSAVCLLNLFFGWFRAFDWLQRNAPAIFGFFNNPVTQCTLIILGLVLSATRLREFLQHKHDASVSSPQEPDLEGRATASGASTAIGSIGNLHAEGNIIFGGNKTIADTGTPDHPIDVSLTCRGVFTPLEIKVGHIGYLVSLNQGLVRLRGFHEIDNKNGHASIYWPDRSRFKTPIGGYRCDVKNHSEVNLARIMFDLKLIYGKTFPPHLPEYTRSIEINHLDHGEEFTFYVFNPCPVYVRMEFSSTAKARLAGRTEMREFPLVPSEKHGYCFDANSENPFGEACQ
jgi:hypothetical protein